MKASQHADALALVKLVDTADDVIRAEILQQYRGIVTVARYILSGEVTTISDAFATDLRVLLADCRTLVQYRTWEAPGDDIECVVTTDDEGFITADSTLTVGRIHTAVIARRDSGRPATQSLALIASTLIGMQLNIAADFSKGADALRTRRDDEDTITGYSFTARHRSA